MDKVSVEYDILCELLLDHPQLKQREHKNGHYLGPAWQDAMQIIERNKGALPELYRAILAHRTSRGEGTPEFSKVRGKNIYNWSRALYQQGRLHGVFQGRLDAFSKERESFLGVDVRVTAFDLSSEIAGQFGLLHRRIEGNLSRLTLEELARGDYRDLRKALQADSYIQTDRLTDPLDLFGARAWLRGRNTRGWIHGREVTLLPAAGVTVLPLMPPAPGTSSEISSSAEGASGGAEVPVSEVAGIPMVTRYRVVSVWYVDVPKLPTGYTLKESAPGEVSPVYPKNLVPGGLYWNKKHECLCEVHRPSGKVFKVSEEGFGPEVSTDGAWFEVATAVK